MKYVDLRDWKNPAEKWSLNKTSLKNRTPHPFPTPPPENGKIAPYLQPGEYSA